MKNDVELFGDHVMLEQVKREGTIIHLPDNVGKKNQAGKAMHDFIVRRLGSEATHLSKGDVVFPTYVTPDNGVLCDIGEGEKLYFIIRATAITGRQL